MEGASQGATPSGIVAGAPWAWALVGDGVIIDLDDHAAASLTGTPGELRGEPAPLVWLPSPSQRLRFVTPQGPQELLIWRRGHLDEIALSLARGQAHSINNLLTPLMAELERSMPTRPPQAGRQALGAKSVDRLADLARSSAALGRVDDASPGVINLGRMVEEVGARVQAGSTAVFSLQVPAMLPEVRADLGLMSQVLEDLLVAAALDSPVGAILAVGVRELPAQGRVPAWLEVYLEDRGAPVAPEHLHELFHPYCRRRPGSDGLTRALVAHRMAMQGGRAQVRPGAVGLRWSLLLPCSVGGRAPAGPVLVYDDDPSMLAMMVEIVALGGHRVIPADGLEACVSAMRQARGSLSAAVLGVNVDVDAVLALGRLRSEQAGLPLVLVGGQLDASRYQAPLVQVPKPFDVDQLLQALLRVIPPSRPA